MVVEADQMQGVLACIDANGASDCSGCLMGHSDVLIVLLSPRSFSERFGAGARPIHPILRHADRPSRCPLWGGYCCKTRFSPMTKILRAVGATFLYKM